MGQREILRKEIGLAKNIIILIGAVWLASLALFVNSISGLGGVGLVTGNLVSDGSAGAAAAPSAPTIVSTVVYFLGLIVLGGAMFVVSRHTQELRTMLKLEKKERATTGSPRQALADFFTIISTWSIKNTAPDIVVASLASIRDSEKKSVASLSNVLFRLSKDEDIEVDVKCEPSWDDVKKIFKAYIFQLGIDREKVLNIADYLGKNDVGAVICNLERDITDMKEHSGPAEEGDKALAPKQEKKAKAKPMPKGKKPATASKKKKR